MCVCTCVRMYVFVSVYVCTCVHWYMYVCMCPSVQYHWLISLSSPSAVVVGHTLLTVNGQPVTNRKLPDGRSALEFLSKPENYPVSLTFAHQRAAVNERLMLLSMFHS